MGLSRREETEPARRRCVFLDNGGDGNFSVDSGVQHVLPGQNEMVLGQDGLRDKSTIQDQVIHVAYLKGRCLTADNLQKRGWPHHQHCHLCSFASEDCTHLFAACNFTNAVWDMLRNWLNIGFQLPRDQDLDLGEWRLQPRVCCRAAHRKSFDSFFSWYAGSYGRRGMQGSPRTEQARLVMYMEQLRMKSLVWRAAGLFKREGDLSLVQPNPFFDRTISCFVFLATQHGGCHRFQQPTVIVISAFPLQF